VGNRARPLDAPSRRFFTTASNRHLAALVVASKVNTFWVSARSSAKRATVPAVALPRRRLCFVEYALEAVELGLFMVSACAFTTAIEHPESPVRALIAADALRRAFIGALMALTAALLIYSPWGKRSGAHMNPAVTLTFLRLGMIEPLDAACYVLGQFAGGVLGVLLSKLLIGAPLAHPAVCFAVTVPGTSGALPAFVAELGISFAMMLMILCISKHARYGRYTGWLAAAFIAAYITFEAPLSGMSMNPARTLGSALVAGVFQHVWLYFVAPPLGMLLAAEVYLAAIHER
jgi:aquaporin Z